MNDSTNIALSKFTSLLESKYGLTIDDASLEHLQFVREYYANRKNEYSSDDIRYKKAFLISEVARLMILREIQPRPGKNKRKKK